MLNLEQLDNRDTPSTAYATNGKVFVNGNNIEPFGHDYIGPLSVTLSYDLNGNGSQEIVVSAGAGGGPRVKIIDSVTYDIITDFFAFEPSFHGGVNVAIDSDNNKLLVGTGQGGAPVIASYDIGTWNEVSRTFYGNSNSRNGIDVSSISTSKNIYSPPEITLGNGSYIIYVDFNGKYTSYEAREILKKVYNKFESLSDLITITGIRPDINVDDYLTVDVGYSVKAFDADAIGFAPTVLGWNKNDNQPNVVYSEYYPEKNVVNIIAHEIGHYFRLTHDESQDNIMNRVNSDKNLVFLDYQLDFMRSVLTFPR